MHTCGPLQELGKNPRKQLNFTGGANKLVVDETGRVDLEVVCPEGFSPLKSAASTTDDPETSCRDLPCSIVGSLGRLMGWCVRALRLKGGFFFFLFLLVPLTFTSGYRTPCSTHFTIYSTSEIILMWLFIFTHNYSHDVSHH